MGVLHLLNVAPIQTSSK